MPLCLRCISVCLAWVLCKGRQIPNIGIGWVLGWVWLYEPIAGVRWTSQPARKGYCLPRLLHLLIWLNIKDVENMSWLQAARMDWSIGACQLLSLAPSNLVQHNTTIATQIRVAWNISIHAIQLCGRKSWWVGMFAVGPVLEVPVGLPLQPTRCPYLLQSDQ